MEKGIEKGLLIGRIQMLEEMLGRAASSHQSLKDKSDPDLKAIESTLRVQLTAR